MSAAVLHEIFKAFADAGTEPSPATLDTLAEWSGTPRGELEDVVRSASGTRPVAGSLRPENVDVPEDF